MELKQLTEKEQKKIKKIVSKIDKLFSPFVKKYCGSCGKSSCCSSCYIGRGFFPDYIFDEIKKRFKFDKKNKKGFLTETGCIIPREFRSITCLSYTCAKMGKNGPSFYKSIRIFSHTLDLEYRKRSLIATKARELTNELYKIRGY